MTEKVLVDIDTAIGLKVVLKNVMTSDSYMIRCELPSPKHVLGLPIGNHVFINAVINGEEIMRAYTPISLDTEHGIVDFAIRVYREGKKNGLPPAGKMSMIIEALNVGDMLNISGPSGQLSYKGFGNFEIGKVDGIKKNFTHVTMIAGGSGITPMYQIVKYISTLKTDKTKISLIYGNLSNESIMLKKELDQLQSQLGEAQFKFTHVIFHPDPDWKGYTGFIISEILAQQGFPAGDHSIALLCGKEEMCDVMLSYLKKLNYNEENIFTF